MHKAIKCLICALIAGALFFALTPGVLVTLPPTYTTSSSISKGECPHSGVWIQMSTLEGTGGGCATSYAAAGVHAAVFALIVFVCCWFWCDHMK